MPTTLKRKWYGRWFLIVGILSGVLGFNLAANAAATNCCIYYEGDEGLACAVINLSTNKLVELGEDKEGKPIKSFVCSLYNSTGGKEAGCENGEVTIDGNGICVSKGEVVFNTSLMGAKELDFSQYYTPAEVDKLGSDLCVKVEGYSAKMTTPADSLCKVGLYVTDNPIATGFSTFKTEYNKAYQQQLGGVDKKALKQALDNLVQKSCCVPLDPSANHCAVPHIKMNYQFALSDSFVPLSEQEKVKNILENLNNNIKNNTLKVEDVIACNVNDTIEGFAFYNLPCGGSYTIEPPSDKYKGFGSTFNGYISSYCAEAKSFEFCGCPKDMKGCAKIDVGSISGCQSEAVKKFGEGAFCKEVVLGYDCANLKGPEAAKPETLGIDASELNKLGTVDAKVLIARFIKTLLGILGSIALVMFVYGGILYMTDAGNSERAAKAKQIFVWTALGLVVIFASYAIVNMIFEAFS